MNSLTIYSFLWPTSSGIVDEAAQVWIRPPSADSQQLFGRDTRGLGRDSLVFPLLHLSCPPPGILENWTSEGQPVGGRGNAQLMGRDRVEINRIGEMNTEEGAGPISGPCGRDRFQAGMYRWRNKSLNNNRAAEKGVSCVPEVCSRVPFCVLLCLVFCHCAAILPAAACFDAGP